ncbi:MAG TPA: hypothetical protein VFB12_16385 [Ktedonobacteraceae bacterium]|nr:hypothetical protein [Ktedonobacteraceae bacterium]
MKRHSNVQQSGALVQLSLFESHDSDGALSPPLEEVLKSLETNVCVESKDAYERRRCVEMAEKLYWPAMSIGPVGRWPGVTIPEGEATWRDCLGQASSGTRGLVLLALHDRLDPLTRESINEETGLHSRPMEIISQVEERLRRHMIQLALALGWPRVSYWAAGKVEVIGPGEEVWRKYAVYGCAGRVADAVGALERRLRGEPERTARQPCYDEDGEELCFKSR